MRHWVKIGLVVLLAWLGTSVESLAQTGQKKVIKTRILFVLDASGSMVSKMDGRTRWETAQDILIKIVDSLKTQPNLEMALRVYGHQYDNKLNNCEDTRLEVPFGPDNVEKIKTKIKRLEPKGNTPITFSLQQAANDYPKDPNGRNVLVLITDGEESCNQDPCAASLALQKRRVFLKPFIVAVGTEQSAAKQFSCIGQYLHANSPSTLRTVMGKVVKQALAKTTVAVVLTDENGKPIETNLNMTFVNNATNEPQYNYVHYMEAGGRADTLNVDPVLTYDLVVNTVPPVVRKDIRIENGKHNPIKIAVPQGYLQFRQDGITSTASTQAIIKNPQNRLTVANQPIGTKERYLAGRYDVEILTTPRIYKADVEIKPGETTLINVPLPGVLNIPSVQEGFGSLYLVHDNGEQTLVYNFPENANRVNISLQPGNYRSVFRAKSAKSSEYTDVQDFSIKPGITTTVRLFSK